MESELWAEFWLLAVGVVFPAQLFAQYIVPWNTTPVAALYVFVLALYVKSLDEGLTRGRSMGLAAAIAVVATIRPVDTIALAPIVLHLALSEWRRWKQGGAAIYRTSVAAVTVGIATGAVIVVSYLALHVLVYGFATSDYQKLSAAIGLDPALIPYRYLLLFNSPRDIYGEGTGILEEYPAVTLGLLGLTYSLLFGRYRGIPLAVLCYLGVYLSYVDFLPSGLWRFGNVHYLKWIFPVLVLLALYSAKEFIRAKKMARMAVAAAIVAPLSLMGFRGESSVVAQADNRNGKDVVLRASTPGPYFAIRFDTGDGNFESLYFPGHRLEIDGRPLFNTYDFKALFASGKANLVLHRPSSFVEARFEVAQKADLRVGGRIELIEPSLTLSNPFRCDTLTAFGVRLC